MTGPITFNKYTREYAAPEVLRRTGPFDAKKADIYSMGVVFYSTFTGRYPKSSDMRFPAGISEEIKTIILRMLSPNPAERPSTGSLLGREPDGNGNFIEWFLKDSIEQTEYDRYVQIAAEKANQYLVKQASKPSAYGGQLVFKSKPGSKGDPDAMTVLTVKEFDERFRNKEVIDAQAVSAADAIGKIKDLAEDLPYEFYQSQEGYKALFVGPQREEGEVGLEALAEVLRRKEAGGEFSYYLQVTKTQGDLLEFKQLTAELRELLA